jgi:hypothetical protein
MIEYMEYIVLLRNAPEKPKNSGYKSIFSIWVKMYYFAHYYLKIAISVIFDCFFEQNMIVSQSMSFLKRKNFCHLR